MKTARRHELHTNELSHQIDELAAYFQKHGWPIVGAIVAIVVVVVAGYMYTSSKRSDAQRAWAELLRPQAIVGATPAEQISYFRGLADKNFDSMLSAMALFQAGNVALGEATSPKVSETQRSDWFKQAEQAYQQIVQNYPQHVIPVSNARLSLGLVAEGRNDAAAAKSIYQQMIDDAALKDYPAQIQARYRIKNLAGWAAPVVFPPPPPSTAPTTSTAPASVTPEVPLKTITPPAMIPTPPATTQPAGS